MYHLILLKKLNLSEDLHTQDDPVINAIKRGQEAEQEKFLQRVPFSEGWHVPRSPAEYSLIAQQGIIASKVLITAIFKPSSSSIY